MSKVFDEHGAGIQSALTAGLSIADVAREQGVAERTVKGWLARGRDNPDSKYGPFAREVDTARAERELPPPGELPLDVDELKLVASRAARKGNVQAMRLMAELLDADEPEAGQSVPGDPLAEADELARRRMGTA